MIPIEIILSPGEATFLARLEVASTNKKALVSSASIMNGWGYMKCLHDYLISPGMLKCVLLVSFGL